MVSKTIVEKSIFLNQWIDENVGIYKRIYPHAKEDDLRDILTEIAIKYAKDVNAQIHNNYEDTTVNTSLLAVMNWVETSKPICAGNGTFFKNQDKETSPIADVIDGRIGARKRYQKIRDTYEVVTYEYGYYEMMQMEAKIKINSIYGSFGTTTYRLFNIYTAASTTGTAQSLISATAEGFISFLGDYVKFKTLGEAAHFIHETLNEEFHLPYDIPVVITERDMVFDRLWNNFFTPDLQNDITDEFLTRILDSCDEEELTRLYYRNNLFEFYRCPKVVELLVRILTNIDEHGFRNPNEVPSNIVDDLNMLWDWTGEFVFYNHAYTERINRLVNDRRKSVIVVDTDSNMINIEPWVDYLHDEIWPTINTNLSDDDKIYASVNTLAFLVTKMVRMLLNKYAQDTNVLERIAPRLNMKNEFYYARMLLANVKKRYIALMRLREGREMNPPKLDIKGHDFKKAGVNDDIKAGLEDIIKTCIMNLDEPDINIPLLLSKLDFLDNDIRSSLEAGDRKYLLRMNCKSALAYKNPNSQGAVHAVILWNTVYPNREISLPDKLDVVYLTIKSPEALDIVEQEYPKEVERIRKYIFNGRNKEHYLTKGITYLALPNDGSKIPGWARPFINVNKIVSRNIGTFDPVVTALGLPEIVGSGSGSDAIKHFSNILDI